MSFLTKKFDTEFVVCSIDVGAATSSLSFIHVQKGDDSQTIHDKVYRVKKWKFHKEESADIPSALCYRDGQPIQRRMGANAKPPGPGEDWFEVRNFKRYVQRLGQKDTTTNDGLPPGVSLATVYEDWLKYLFNSGEEAFINDSNIPDDVWERRLCVFVCPNGWTEAEKANVQKIIHKARCVEYDGHVRFARESEATLHYCLYHGLAEELTKPIGLEFFICNAGYATTDIGFYKVTSVDPLQYTEVSAARSLDAGSADPNNFNAVNMIEKTVRDMKQKASAQPKYLVLGGGYAHNEAAKTQLSNNLKKDSISVKAPLTGPSHFGLKESPTVDGGLYSLLHNFVSARMTGWTYGTDILIDYNEATASDELKRRYQSNSYNHAGKKYVRLGWSTIAKKGECIRDGETRKHNYRQLWTYKPTENQTASCTLYASEELEPTWIKDEKGEKFVKGMRELCTVSGPIRMNDVKLNEVRYEGNKIAWEIPFYFAIDFGSVTSKASLFWEGLDNKPAFEPCSFHPPHDSEAVWH